LIGGGPARTGISGETASASAAGDGGK
jgi:hypothetical protein